MDITPRRETAAGLSWRGIATGSLQHAAVAGALLALAGTLHAEPPRGATVIASAAPTSQGSVQPSSSPRQAAPRAAKSGVSCLMTPERVADIGSPVIGVVSAVQVDTGDEVREGQLLVALRAEVESAGVQAAEMRARIDADERAAAANLVLTSQRLQRSIQLEQQGFVSNQSTEQARAENEVAAQKLEQARGQKKVSLRELGVVRAQLGQRTVRSPFNGVVTERFVNAGERVEDKPMLRVAMLDPLRVELVMPASRFGTMSVNDTVSVQPELLNVAAVTARVTRIDKVIDGASNTFRVRLNLPNPGNKLPAGARCRVQLPALDASAASPALSMSPSLSSTPRPAVSGKPAG
jgi:RND family efflux transporter MFP subunit